MAIYQSQYTGKDIDKVVGELGNGLMKGKGNYSLVQTNNNILEGNNQVENLNDLRAQEEKRALGNYSAAFGYETVAGCTGYYITAISETELKKNNELIITIKANVEEQPLSTTGWEINDYVYIKLKWNYNHIGYISKIDAENNQITITLTQDIKINPSSYDGLNSATNKFGLNDNNGTPIDTTTYQYSGDVFSVRVPAKPLGGKEILTSASYAIGYGTKATATGAHAEGAYSIAGGRYSHAEGQSTEAGQGAHAEGKNTQALGEQAHSEGMNTKALGDQSHAEGHGTIASGYMSHAENRFTQAIGQYSHAEGNNTKASGHGSHAEGMNHTYKKGEETKTIQLEASGEGAHAEGSGTVASGKAAHAEGSSFTNSDGTIVLPQTASGEASHVEGIGNTASGKASHAEGQNTKALGAYSHVEGRDGKTNTEAEGAHVEGLNTIATLSYQHVQGKHNVEDNEKKYAHIVGNGKSANERSNAHTLDWDGNAWFAGKIQVGDVNNKVDLIDSNELNEQLNEVDKQTKRYLYDLDYTFVQATDHENDLKLGLANVPGVEFDKIDNKWGYKILTGVAKPIQFNEEKAINVNTTKKVGAWIYYKPNADYIINNETTIRFEFSPVISQYDDKNEIEFVLKLKEGWNYYVCDFDINSKRDGTNNVYSYDGNKNTISDYINIRHFRILNMTTAFNNGTIYIGRVAVLTPEENQAIENTLRLQAIVEGAGTSFDTLKEIETEFNTLSETATGLSEEIDELEASVKELQETGIEVELTQEQIDDIIEQIGTEGLQINSMENSTITAWFNFA